MTGSGRTRTGTVTFAVAEQPRESVATTVTIVAWPLGSLVNSTLDPLSVVMVPCEIDHCMAAQFVFGSAGGSIETELVEPGQTLGSSSRRTGAAIVRTGMVRLAEFEHPLLSVAMTVSVAGA